MSVSVAATIASGIVDSAKVTLPIILAGLLGATGWSVLTWYFGLPSSSSHALVGGVIAATVVAAASVLGVAGITGARDQRCAENDGRWSPTALHKDARPPIWVITMCSVAIAVGTYAEEWRVVRTVGHRLTNIAPPRGLCRRDRLRCGTAHLYTRGRSAVDHADHDRLGHRRWPGQPRRQRAVGARRPGVILVAALAAALLASVWIRSRHPLVKPTTSTITRSRRPHSTPALWPRPGGTDGRIDRVGHSRLWARPGCWAGLCRPFGVGRGLRRRSAVVLCSVARL